MVDSALLEVSGVSKRYGPIVALDGAHLTLHAGQVSGLVGKNGAGKSTLIKSITGVVEPDEGTISFDGSDLVGQSIRSINGRGLACVPQESSLWPDMSVVENIAIPDLYSTRGRWIDWKRSRRIAQQSLQRVGLDVRLDALASNLSIPAQRRLMIARALSRNPKLLILDEPTEAFTETEVADLFVTLQALVKDGMGMLYVSHRLEEVIEIAEQITVISDGRNVATVPTEGIDRNRLVESIVGSRQLAMEEETVERAAFPEDRRSEPVLETRRLTGSTIRQVDLTLRAGEIVGVYGLAGSGRSDLIHCIAGARSTREGHVLLGDADISSHSLARRRRAGLFLLGEDRKVQGLLPELSIRENVALGSGQFRSGVSLKRRERAEALTALARVGFSRTDVETAIARLSGGNQQKVLLARGLVARARIWLLDEPTVGLDVAARADLFDTLRSVVSTVDGAAAVVALSDVDDLRAVTDRVVVLRAGRIVADISSAEVTEENLLYIASFAQPNATPESTAD